MTKYALHFGVVPVAPLAIAGVAGWSNPNVEHPFPFLGTTAYVSGSWACWGPADQETDGDDTLHVLVYVEAEEDDLPEVAQRLGSVLEENYISEGSRLLDWGVVSDPEDFSDGQAIFTGKGSVLYVPVPSL